MSSVHVCTNGHKWQPSSTGVLAAVCPFCGAAALSSSVQVAVSAELAGAPTRFDETLARPEGLTSDSPTAVQAPPSMQDETLARPPSTQVAAPPPARAAPADRPAFDETLARPPVGAAPPAAADESTGSWRGAIVPAVDLFGETLQRPAAPVPPPPDDPFGETLQRLRPGLDTNQRAPAEPTGGADVHGGDTLAQGSDAPILQPASVKERNLVEGYDILGVLGRGGMGVVYKARQKGLNRLVALKMILSGAHASSVDLHRFRTEAEAVAHLQHPNIVQIHEIGERNSLPFFSLEFVEGGTLSQKLQGTPMPPLQAAALIEKLARALHYAHERGIVHRDIKPANILLTADGTPKITDFGLAKRIETDQNVTGDGAILGTPTYMAPEQAEGRTRDIGPGADVYSLGALLYDLLTGRPPFCGSTIMDTLNQVMFAEPVPPARLAPKVPRDLETICLKCLHKEIGKRYRSAADLAEDLDCFLAGKPIQARPTPWYERAYKWAKRRPTAASLVGVCVLAVLLTIVGLSVAANREATLRGQAEEARDQKEAQRKLATEARDEALKQKNIAQKERDAKEVQRKLAVEQRQLAATNFALARSSVNDYLTRVSEEKLLREPRMTKLRRALLVQALDYYEKFLAQKPDAALQWEIVEAQKRVGDIHENLGELESALTAYERAEELLRPLLAQQRKPEYQFALSALHNNRGLILQTLERKQDAEKEYDQAIAVLRELVEQRKLAVYQPELATAYNSRANLIRFDPARFQDARATYLKALQLLAEQVGPQAKARVLHLLAQTHSNLGALLADRVPAEAETAFEQALQVQTELLAWRNLPEYRVEKGRAHLNLGELWLRTGTAARAKDAFTAAEELFVELGKDYPDVAEYRHHLAMTYNNLSKWHNQAKNFSEMDRYLDLAKTEWRKLMALAPDVPGHQRDHALTLNEEAIRLAVKNEPDKAIALQEQAVGALKKLTLEYPGHGSYPVDLALIYYNLAQMVAMKNNAAGVEKNYRLALEQIEGLKKQQPSLAVEARDMLLKAHLGLAQLYGSTKREQQSEPHWQAVAELLEEQARASPKDVQAQLRWAESWNIVGKLLQKRQAWPELRSASTKALGAAQAALQVAPKLPAAQAELATAGLSLTEAQVALKEHAAASKTALTLQKSLPADAKDVHARLARQVARCVPLAGVDKKLAEQYGKQAVELLRLAHKHGYRDVQQMQSAAEYDAIRMRADFQQLLKEMESK